jgi:hypothetical protein
MEFTSEKSGGNFVFQQDFPILSWIFDFWVRFLLCSTSIFMLGKAHEFQGLSKSRSNLDSCLKVPYFGKAPALGLGLGLYQNSRAPLALTSWPLILVKSCSWGFTLVVMPSSEGLTSLLERKEANGWDERRHIEPVAEIIFVWHYEPTF